MPKKGLTETIKFNLEGEELLLLPQKAIYWKAKKILLIADLHLGKVIHFRSNGIAVPKEVVEKNWQLLHTLFKDLKPEKVFFLGDLFHSVHNREWDDFRKLIKEYPAVKYVLILGNHDILEKEKYTALDFTIVEQLVEPPFLFTHEPLENESIHYNLAGHIHPAVRMKGKGKQIFRATCFYFGKKRGILPAFGAFTGRANIKPTKSDKVFVIINEKVIEI